VRITIDTVEKNYPGGVRAVDRVSLQVKDGEFLVLVGPSGCGKTTLLRMIAGLEETNGGAITIGDRRVDGLPPGDRDLAMVFQNYALYPHMTVRKNMAFALELRKLPKEEIERRVLEAAETLGIGNLLGEDLDRDLAVQPGVAGAVDLAHAPRAEQPHDLVRAESRACLERHRYTPAPPALLLEKDRLAGW